MSRKILAVGFLVILVASMLLIDRDDELAVHNHKLQAWADFYNRWHDLPAFSKEGKWLVESTFDHKAHWNWQLDMIRQQEVIDRKGIAHESPKK